MAREIQILRWCDACADGDTQTPATETWTVGLGSGEDVRPALKVADLCADHWKALVQPLRDLLAAVGQTPTEPAKLGPGRPRTRTAPGDDAVVCRICGRTYGRVGSLTNHLYIDHMKTARRPPMALTCPTCGVKSNTSQGATAHLSLEHGITALETGYARLEAMGKRAQ